MTEQDVPGRWRRFTTALAVSLTAVVLVLAGLIVVTDPYGMRRAAGVPAGPIMDLNQRFMYPQIVRSRQYDSAVFGTSTVRLLDPKALDAALGGRFANLAMNAATPWEQMQIAQLFLRETPAPRMVILGIDTTWCEADAADPAKRLTFRAFPPWLYRPLSLSDWIETFDLKSLEIAGRVMLNWLGVQEERIRADGFEVFTPPEDFYDPARAAIHLWGPLGRPTGRLTDALVAKDNVHLSFPALDWLKEFISKTPPLTEIVIVFPPTHVSSMPLQGSAEAERQSACKARVADIAGTRAVVLDLRFPSPITTADDNYWDPLHYRLPIAARFVAAIASGSRGDDLTTGEIMRILNRPDRRKP